MKSGTVNLYILFCVITWGSSYVFVEIGLKDFTPSQLASYRFSIASMTMMPILFIRKVRIPNLKESLIILVISSVGVSTYQIALNLSTLYFSANNVSFVANSIPIFITALSGVLLKEKTSLVGWFSLFIGLFGVAILNYNGGFQFDWRVLILLIIPLSASIFFILQKSLLKTLKSYEIMVYTIIAGSMILLLYDHTFFGAIRDARTLSNMAIVYLGIIPTAIGYTLWAQVLTKMDVSLASRFIYLVPVVTIIFSVLLLGAIPGLNTFVGGGVILSGVYISQMK